MPDIPKEVVAALLGLLGGLVSSGLLLFSTLRTKALDRSTEREKLAAAAALERERQAVSQAVEREKLVAALAIERERQAAAQALEQERQVAAQATEREKLWVGAYDTKLLEARLVDYRSLWGLTKAGSPRLVRHLDTTSARLLADELTNWYYQHGMLLSATAREAFFGARNAMVGRPFVMFTDITAKFSALRTALCEDLNSRRGPTLAFREALTSEDEAAVEIQACDY